MNKIKGKSEYKPVARNMSITAYWADQNFMIIFSEE